MNQHVFARIMQNIQEVEARCRRLVAIDPRFALRKHQRDLLQLLPHVFAGHHEWTADRALVAEVVPGGGKSYLAAMLSSILIGSGFVERAIWITPRLNLNRQARGDFVPRPAAGLVLPEAIDSLRASCFNPADILAFELTSAGHLFQDDLFDGVPHVFTTTFQMVGKQRRQFMDYVTRYRTLIIVDECQMLYDQDDDGECWFAHVKAVADAALAGHPDLWLFLMSGGLYRHDKKRSPWARYYPGDPLRGQSPDEAYPRPNIRYTLQDGQNERAIIRLDFDIYDGDVRYEYQGDEFSLTLSGDLDGEAARALSVYLMDRRVWGKILDDAVTSWRAYNEALQYHSQFLVISMSIEEAKRHADYLRGLGLRILLVHSKLKGQDASGMLEANRKTPSLHDGIVSVGMAYIGMNLPCLTHLAFLHNIRSLSWWNQAIFRPARMDYQCPHPWEVQFARILVPADPLARLIVQQIMSQQAQGLPAGLPPVPPIVRERRPGPVNGGVPAVTPISAEVTSRCFRTQHDVLDDPAALDDIVRRHPPLNHMPRSAARALVANILASAGRPVPEIAQPFVHPQDDHDALRAHLDDSVRGVVNVIRRRGGDLHWQQANRHLRDRFGMKGHKGRDGWPAATLRNAIAHVDAASARLAADPTLREAGL